MLHIALANDVTLGPKDQEKATDKQDSRLHYKARGVLYAVIAKDAIRIRRSNADRYFGIGRYCEERHAPNLSKLYYTWSNHVIL
jgi:hypothetical protein